MFSKRHKNPKRYAPIRLAIASERLKDTHDPLATSRPNLYREILSSMTSGSSAELEPANLDTGNDLRPGRLADLVGQEELKPLLARLVANAKAPGRRLPHLLMVGASGTGKTTVSLVVAREMGSRCFVLRAPVGMDTLDALRTQARDGDLVFIDEIHMMVSGDRRGITQACDPESFYMLLEDSVLALPTGPKPFPKVTFIGATTDVGLLPEALTNRFPLQPRLRPYTEVDMTRLASNNATALGMLIQAGACEIFARASRLNPRQLNSYVRSAQALATTSTITMELATEVITELAGSTLDGLTPSMQTALRYLYQSCERSYRDGRVQYSASVNQLATACGHGRDTKAVALLLEPWLIQAGYLSIQHTGRVLTPKGIERARGLVK